MGQALAVLEIDMEERQKNSLQGSTPPPRSVTLDNLHTKENKKQKMTLGKVPAPAVWQ